ncbi:hypothetical protein [Marinitoga aeolica]|uniref:Uncharacterized protein n=1 Tax=Marinitoga aeolica TaxID=2809031 RepID=A0ABY8PT49_9BACT|nr:hypothetical protein [Marinitoga aeolica]WGS65784.1 hypothetical protein JRV97_04345 [Marinitoga aeolica]
MNNKDLLSKEERKKGAKSLLVIFAIMFSIYVVIWLAWNQYEKVLNEFKILPTLQIEKAKWINIYSKDKIIKTKIGNIEIKKIDETNFVIKYKDKMFNERAFRYFNVREKNDAILISFPSFYIRGIKNIVITDQGKVYKFYKVPTDLNDEYDMLFADFLLGNNKGIEISNIPDVFKNDIKGKNSIVVNSKYTKFFLDNIEKIYKLSDYMYLFVKNNDTSNFVEYYMVNAEEENREEKNYILRIFLVEK